MENRRIPPDPSFLYIVAIVVFGVTFFTLSALAEPVKTIRLSDDSVARVQISTRGTVLSFPVKPSKVILGKAGSFGIEYVENDLAISPLHSMARSNLFVYLFSRRFSFDLVAASTEGSSVILIRDARDPKPASTQAGK